MEEEQWDAHLKQCKILYSELRRMEQSGVDTKEVTVKYCIETATHLVNAAKCLCEMRLTKPVPEPPLDEGM